jgi:hypothetical protein
MKKTMKLSFLAILMTLFIFCSCMAASSDNSCDGHWKGHFVDSARGWPVDVDMTISGNTGIWIAHLGKHKASKSPCREVEFPVTVLKCTESEFHFFVDGSSVERRGSTCPTFTARLVRKDADTAEGVKNHEEPLQMIRQSRPSNR